MKKIYHSYQDIDTQARKVLLRVLKKNRTLGIYRFYLHIINNHKIKKGYYNELYSLAKRKKTQQNEEGDLIQATNRDEMYSLWNYIENIMIWKEYNYRLRKKIKNDFIKEYSSELGLSLKRNYINNLQRCFDWFIIFFLLIILAFSFITDNVGIQLYLAFVVILALIFVFLFYRRYEKK